MALDEVPTLVPLRDLMPLRPWRSSRAPFPVQYQKVKEPLYRNGARVFWQIKTLQREEDMEFDAIPYEGFFEFIYNRVIKTIKKWIDRLLGQLFGLPKHEY